MVKYINLSRYFLSCKLLADGGAIKLDIPVLIPHNIIRNLLGLVINLRHLPPDKPLNREECILRVHHGLPLSNLAHQPIAIFSVGNHGGCRPLSLGIGDDGRLPSLHRRHRRIGGAEVNPDNLLRHHTKSSATAAGSMLTLQLQSEGGGTAADTGAEEHSPIVIVSGGLDGGEVSRGAEGVDLSSRGRHRRRIEVWSW